MRRGCLGTRRSDLQCRVSNGANSDRSSLPFRRQALSSCQLFGINRTSEPDPSPPSCHLYSPLSCLSLVAGRVHNSIWELYLMRAEGWAARSFPGEHAMDLREVQVGCLFGGLEWFMARLQTAGLQPAPLAQPRGGSCCWCHHTINLQHSLGTAVQTGGRLGTAPGRQVWSLRRPPGSRGGMGDSDLPAAQQQVSGRASSRPLTQVPLSAQAGHRPLPGSEMGDKTQHSPVTPILPAEAPVCSCLNNSGCFSQHFQPLSETVMPQTGEIPDLGQTINLPRTFTGLTSFCLCQKPAGLGTCVC